MERQPGGGQGSFGEPAGDFVGAGAGYRRDGYALLEGMMPKEVTTAVYNRLAADLDLARSARNYTVERALLAKPAIEVYSHVYAPLATLLWGLTPVAAALAGKRLLPTYAYFRAYQQGDICRVHSDRLACEHSMSLTLLLGEERPWALTVERERRDGPVSSIDEDYGGGDFAELPMGSGDAVMYQGVNHRHGRLLPNPNSWSAHLFLHWVDADGPHAEQAFDRPALKANNMAGQG